MITTFTTRISLYTCMMIMTIHCYAKATVEANWDGPYIGINGGGGFEQTRYTFSPNSGNQQNYAPTNGGQFNQTPNGGVAGGFIGNNWQMGPAVFGIATAMEWLGLSATSQNPFGNNVIGNATYQTNMNWVYSIMPQLGYAYHHWLVYGKTALAITNLSTQLSNDNNPGTVQNYPSHFKQSQYALGAAFGGGIDYQYQHWLFGIEYNYFDFFGSRPFGGSDNPNFGGNYALQYQVHTAFSSVTAQLAYRFNS